MNAFSFYSSHGLICKPGAIQDLGAYCSSNRYQKALLVTDPGIVAVGLLQPVVEALQANQVEVAVYDQVQADPAQRIVEQATQYAIDTQAEAIIGLGGGSSLDVAKLVALLAKGEERLDEIYGVNLVKGTRLPLIQIPTTSGTGSEVTAVSIITVGETEKKGVVSPRLLPDLAVLDAELTVGLPAMITATTGIDAMVHAIEAYTSVNPNHNGISDLFACKALELLGGNIRQAVMDGSDLDVRSEMLLGSMLAGQAFANSPVAAVHALAYPLGGIYHLSHGLTNALVLPHVMQFNQAVCAQKYAELAPIVFPDMAQISDSAERSDQFIEALAQLNRDLLGEVRLRDYGIEESALPMLAEEAMKQTRLLGNNPREVTQEDALKIYQAAW